jgi:hypothetical protein
MERISLKLYEIYNLEAELNGFSNPQTGEKIFSGLLKEKMSLSVKYWLNDLAKRVSAEKTAIEELKNELIRKYGKPDDKGNVTIPVYIDEYDSSEVPKKVLNPDYQAFDKEFSELMNTEKELEYKPFELSDFAAVETVDNYVILFKLIKNKD